VNRKNASPLPLRLVTLLFGILLLIWLPFEDSRVEWVILLSVLLISLGIAWFLWAYSRTHTLTMWIYPLTGLIAGCMVVLTALLLMAFKSGAHGHNAPDFTPDQVTRILRSLPAWILGGCLLGLGFGLWKVTK
jgi:hypothetical protein